MISIPFVVTDSLQLYIVHVGDYSDNEGQCGIYFIYFYLINLAVADLFTLNIYGLQGSLVTSLAHGLSSSGLFCSVGFIQDRTDNRNLFTLAFINSFNMYPVFSTSLFLLILGTTSFPGTLNFIGELFNMISLSIVDVVFNGLFVTSIPLTTSYSLFLFKRSLL